MSFKLTAFATVAVMALLVAPIPASAQSYTSTYTKLDFDKHCKVIEEYELGVSAECTGYSVYPVHFSEGDLRVSVRFGAIVPGSRRWESFGEFNNVGNTIEWRLSQGLPVATILRWYIDATNEQTGILEKGEVLVISTIATRANFGSSCVVGYVDARANSNANVLARNVADTIAASFRCDVDSPKFHGHRGPYSGNPTNFSG